jgi:CSLREA domain-containing protein
VKRGGLLITGICVAVGLMAAPAQGRTFEVTRTGDTVPNGCGNGGCTLREAVIAANDRTGADTIVLRSGRTHVLEIPGADDDAVLGDLDLLGPTTIRASGRRRATVDGQLVDRIFHAFAALRLNGLVVTDGLLGIQQSGAGGVSGSRLRVIGNAGTGIFEEDDGGVRLVRSAVGNNEGTGIQEEDGGKVSLPGGRVTGNQFTGVEESGGGSVSVVRARILDNGPTGVYEFDAGRLDGSRATFARNAGSGLQEFGPGALVLNRSLVTRNEDSGVQVFDGGGNRIVRSTITRNETAGFGGGLFTNVRVAIRETTVARNDAILGGGIFAAADAELTVTNSTVANNETADSGAGIFVASAADVTLNAVTVARNRAGNDGGGLYLEGPDGAMTVDNSLIALNTVPDGGFVGADCFNEQDDYASGGGNVLSTDDNCSAFDGPGDIVRPNPKLGPLKANGGPTATIALKQGSPAIGQARRDAPGRDQRGRKRDSNPDAGAFER